jgi:cytochrome P450
MEMVACDYFNIKNGKFWEENGDEVVVDLFQFTYGLILRMNCINFMSPRVYMNHVEEFIELFTILDVENNFQNPVINGLKNRFNMKKENAAWKRWICIMMPDVERCLKMIENNVEPTDLDFMYEIVKYSKQELEKHEQPFTPRLVAFFTYGSFISAQASAHSIAAYLILEWIRHKNDEIGRQMKKEIESAPQIGKLTIEYLNSMKFVQACIYEIIRLRLYSQLLFRYAAEDVLLSDKKYIPSGNLVVSVLTRPLDLYLNPDKFDPERHLPPREENKSDPYRALPFGRGKHPCPGEHFAKIQIKLLLIQLSKMCKLEIMKESINFEATINKEQWSVHNRPSKPVLIKISKNKLSGGTGIWKQATFSCNKLVYMGKSTKNGTYPSFIRL